MVFYFIDLFLKIPEVFEFLAADRIFTSQIFHSENFFDGYEIYIRLAYPTKFNFM
jgi:hypothetical protein